MDWWMDLMIRVVIDAERIIADNCSVFFFVLVSLYAKGRILGHKRGKRNTRPNTSLIQIEGVSNKEDAQFYLGKVSYPFPTLRLYSKAA